MRLRRVTKVPFFDLKRQFLPLREEILSEIAATCDAQNFILGSRVEQLEKAIASLSGGGYAVGVSSGTDAELLILMALGVGPGDAVVTTPFTFFSTAGCIARMGAKPVFVDIDPETFSLSPRNWSCFSLPSAPSMRGASGRVTGFESEQSSRSISSVSAVRWTKYRRSVSAMRCR